MAAPVRKRGVALQKLGRPGEAVEAYRESITLLEGLEKPEADDVYDLACSHALIHGVASEKGSGLTATAAFAAGEQAIATLRRAIAAGYRGLADMRRNTELDSLRKRPEFGKLLAELEKDSKASGK
jgi:hypothetical protein